MRGPLIGIATGGAVVVMAFVAVRSVKNIARHATMAAPVAATNAPQKDEAKAREEKAREEKAQQEKAQQEREAIKDRVEEQLQARLSAQAAREDLVRHEKIHAWVQAKQFIKQRLKSPSSADFGEGILLPSQAPEVVKVTETIFIASGWVDAQNSLGVVLRNYWGCVLAKKSDSHGYTAFDCVKTVLHEDSAQINKWVTAMAWEAMPRETTRRLEEALGYRGSREPKEEEKAKQKPLGSWASKPPTGLQKITQTLEQEEGLRLLQLKEGRDRRDIYARVVDRVGDRVRLQAGDGTTRVLNIRDFRKVDQKYLRAWTKKK